MYTFIAKDFQHGGRNPVIKLVGGYGVLKTFTGSTAERRMKAYQRKYYSLPPANPIPYTQNLVC